MQESSVEPVVTTSSTSSTCRPANAPGRATANKSRTFSQRPAEERVVWLGLLRRRLTARSYTGTPIREAIPSAI